MKRLLQKLRGMVSLGVTWGTLWGVIGAGIGFVVGGVSLGTPQWSNPIVVWAIGMALYGLTSGIAFGGLLTLGEGRKTILELSLARVAMWGALGAALVPVFFGLLGTFEPGTTLVDVIGAIGVTAALGGTFAPGTVAIARRGELSAPSERAMLDV